MRLTSKGRYAVTAMLDVALNSEAGPVPLADISERQEFPFLIWNNCFPVCVKWSGFQRTWTGRWLSVRQRCQQHRRWRGD